MKKSLIELLDKLNDDDLKALSYLYLYRAMDVNQLMVYVYRLNLEGVMDKKEQTSIKRKQTVIRNRLIGNGVATISVYHRGKEAMQITNKGIEIVRYARDIPNEVWDSDKKVVKRGYYTQADLVMNTRLVNHQVHLNQFMLEFGERARAINLPWNYYDEKFLSSYVGIRPDGMLTVLDHDLFIETDMATESKVQLIEKWQHYRTFLASDEFRCKPRKIVVLFTIEGIISKTKIKNRIELVKQTIIDTFLDELKPDFEIVIKTRSEILNYLFDSLFPRILNKNRQENILLQYLQKHDFTPSYGYNLNAYLLGDFYQYYVRKLDKAGKIVSKNGTPQEYFFDLYLDEEISVLHRIDYYKKNNRLYEEAFGRPINLVIVVNDLEKAYKDLGLLGAKALGHQGIFILDLSRMSYKNDVYQNLIQITVHGEVFRIVSSDHSRREFLYRLHDTEMRQKKGRVTKIHEPKTSTIK